MNICETQINMLQTLFQNFDQDNKGYLIEKELRCLLTEFEIDESFAPLMLRLFSCSENSSDEQKDNTEQQKITFNNFIAFFKILLSGDMKSFFNLIFTAIDFDRNGKIGIEELIEFSTLIGDSLTEQEAKYILRECSKKNNLNKVMNNTKIRNYHFENNQNQELGTKDDTIPYSCSNSPLSKEAGYKLKRSKSHRSFLVESKNFVLNDVDFEQLWKCYS